jgi:hypothetical protein
MRRFHDPGCVRLSAEFLYENVVVTWEDISLGNDVHVDVAAELVFFSEGRVFALEIFTISFNIFNHQVLLAKLV